MTRFYDAIGPVDAEFIRVLRNAVRHNLTRSGNEITVEEQRAWWVSEERRRRAVTMVCDQAVADGDGYRRPVIGFGMVKPNSVEGWLTGAISEGHRGKGHGRALFEYMISWCRLNDLVPWLEVFVDNVPALRLYQALGFQVATTRVALATPPSLAEPRSVLVMNLELK